MGKNQPPGLWAFLGGGQAGAWLGAGWVYPAIKWGGVGWLLQ